MQIITRILVKIAYYLRAIANRLDQFCGVKPIEKPLWWTSDAIIFKRLNPDRQVKIYRIPGTSRVIVWDVVSKQIVTR